MPAKMKPKNVFITVRIKSNEKADLVAIQNVYGFERISTTFRNILKVAKYITENETDKFMLYLSK